jgi:hypothetical protein
LSHFVLVKKRNYSATSFMLPAGLEMRLDNDATHLADAQSRRKETAKGEKGVFRGHPEPRQRATPSALPKRYLGE